MNNTNFEIRTLADRTGVFLAIRREDGKQFGPADETAMRSAMISSDAGIDYRARFRESMAGIHQRVPLRQRESRVEAQRRRIRESEARQQARAFTQAWEKATPV